MKIIIIIFNIIVIENSNEKNLFYNWMVQFDSMAF